MKKGLFNKYAIIVPLIVVLFSAVLWSCKKKETKCFAIITVVDNTTTPVSGANVHLYATLTGGGTGDVTADAVTDGSGKANFEFKLQAIFNVTVTAGALNGSGIVKLEPGETVEKTITVQ